ncbi:MAG: branched-chain amino acid transport system II carrier protein [Chlamydiota bacterium]|nr:branched-chain amino acid transport system II carrier protein [Chlamydiota bacterium]
MIHKLSSKSYRLAIGLALFAMFFGSGNLIFPLSIGYFSQDQWVWGSLGFLLTGVLLPFVGVITMVIYQGDYTKFFEVLGKKGGFLFAFALLSAWIPFGSGPRCVVLSYANVEGFLFNVPLWAYSIVYSAIVYIIAFRKSAALDILGYILTPLLLLCLASVVYLGVQGSTGIIEGSVKAPVAFSHAVIQGYQTQDLIASFFFAAAVIDIVSRNLKDGISPLKATFHSSIIGVTLLGIVYIGLIILASSSGKLLNGVTDDYLLTTLVNNFLPPKLAFTGSFAVALACLTTSVALTFVYADFLQANFFQGKNGHAIAIFITVGITFLFSLAGFETISSVISPLMQFFYPCLILMIIWNLAKYVKNGTL